MIDESALKWIDRIRGSFCREQEWEVGGVKAGGLLLHGASCGATERRKERNCVKRSFWRMETGF